MAKNVHRQAETNYDILLLEVYSCNFLYHQISKTAEIRPSGKGGTAILGAEAILLHWALIMADQDYIVFVDVGKKENLVYNDASFVISLLSSTKIWRAKSMHSVLQI